MVEKRDGFMSNNKKVKLLNLINVGNINRIQTKISITLNDVRNLEALTPFIGER